MSKEYHVFTHIENSHQQAFIFEVERNEIEHMIRLHELWLITSHGNQEVRSRVKIDLMIQSIAEQSGGNVDDNKLDVILDMFKDVLPNEKKHEIMLDRIEHEEELVKDMDPNLLLESADYALFIEQHNSDEDDKSSTTD